MVVGDPGRGHELDLGAGDGVAGSVATGAFEDPGGRSCRKREFREGRDSDREQYGKPVSMIISLRRSAGAAAKRPRS